MRPHQPRLVRMVAVMAIVVLVDLALVLALIEGQTILEGLIFLMGQDLKFHPLMDQYDGWGVNHLSCTWAMTNGRQSP